MKHLTGTLKWLNQTYGLGFIAPDHSGQAVFVILKDLDPPVDPCDLITGCRLAYTAMIHQHGPRATAITVLDEVPPPLLKNR